MPEYIGLLRGINVGGRNRVPMPELRSLAEALGWTEVRTYIQSGNLLFRAEGEPPELETELERAIAERLGLSVPVLVRDAAAWADYVRANPFPEATREEPNRVMLALSKAPPAPDAATRLRERAEAGERVERTGDALWIHFPDGSGRSRLTPALLDRVAASPVTTRNWRTVLELAALAGRTEG